MTKGQGTVVIVLLTIIVVVLTGIFLVTSANLLMQNMWQFTSSSAFSSPPPVVTLESPDTIALGEEFDLVLVAKNTTLEPIQMDSIDIDNAFLAGFEVVSVSPQPTGDLDIGVQRSWTFNESIPAGASLTFTYRLKPTRVGRFAGSLDVYNATMDSASVIAAIQVESAETGSD